MPPIVIAGAIAAAGAVGGAVIGSKASGKAADAQTQAANYAADLQAKAAADALAFQKQQFAQGQQNIAPWLTAGQSGLSSLLYGLGLGTMTPVTQDQMQQASALQTQLSQIQKFSPMISQTETLQGFIGKLEGMLAHPENMDPNDRAITQNFLARLQANPGIFDSLKPSNVDATMANLQSQIATSQAPQITPGSATGMPLGYGEFTKNFGAEDFTADPGYQFRLSEGNKAIERSAAARGGALSGGAVKAAERYSSGLASQEYQNAFDRYVNQQTNKYNKFASLAGVGQIAANTATAAGQNYANNAGNILMGSAGNIGDLATQAANARASGYIGSANAWGGALGNIGNTAMNTVLLSQLLKPQPTTGGGTYPWW